MSALDDAGSIAGTDGGDEVNEKDITTELHRDSMPVAVILVRCNTTMEEFSRPLATLQGTKVRALEHDYRGQMEVNCGNTLQGLWGVQRPKNKTELAEQNGFTEVGTNLKGAKAVCRH